MNDTVRLVITGPAAASTKSIALALSEAGMAPEMTPAPDDAALRTALAAPHDALVAAAEQVLDKAFMHTVRDAAPDLPVVALDKAPDARRSMDVIQAGATCLLAADELDRLPAHIAGCRRMALLLKERRSFRRGMAEFKARFNHLFEHSPDGVIIFDDAGLVMEANESFERLFRYRADEIKGKRLRDIIVPTDLHDEFEANMAQVTSGVMVRAETVRRRKDGSQVHVAVQGCPIMLHEGFIGAYAIYTDISSRIRALEALRRAESKYRSIFENAVEGMYISTPFGRFVTVNKAMSDLLGYDSPSDLTDTVKSIRREIYAEPEMRDDFRRRIEQTGTVAGFVSTVMRRDGSRLTIMENVRAMHDDDGDLLYFQGTIQPLPDSES